MKAFRTPWWYYLIGIAMGLACGVLLLLVTETTPLSLAGAPWLVVVLLIICGVVTFILAWQTYQYVRAKPGARKVQSPQRSIVALMLAKSLAMAGAILVGWYSGQVLFAVWHSDVPLYGAVVRECAVAAFVAFADMIVGIVSEGMCQLPPQDGPENAARA